MKVEARSPALIESVKTAVTDANGEYQIVDLRPGTYSLAFTLNGFQTAKYENIVLTPSFTATINPVLQVGAVEQSVEVTGQAPIVDITSAVSEKALTQQTLEEVPVGRSVYQVTLFMPGATTTSPDVGGSQTAQITNLAMHGTVDNTFAVDGMEINGVESNNVTATYYNEGFNQAMTVQTSALPAEDGGGVTVNMVKKQGSNTLHGDFYFTGTDHALQADNLSASQKALGLKAASAMDEAYDLNGGIGGAIRKNKLWYYGNFRRWIVNRLVANTFYPNGAQALDPQRLQTYSLDLNYKLNEKNTVTGFIEYLDKLRKARRDTSSLYQYISPEAAAVQPNTGTTADVHWTSTINPRLIFEAGFASMHIQFSETTEPGVSANALPEIELATSTLMGALIPTLGNPEVDWRRAATATLNYVPSWWGSHNIRVGYVYGSGTVWEKSFDINRSTVAEFTNGVPTAIVTYNTPIYPYNNQSNPSAFAQDSWTIKRRLTINYGLRWDEFVGSIPAESAPAGVWVPARTTAAINNSPNWKTWAPRIGIAYSPTTAGKTVIKASASKYEVRETAGGIVAPFNPEFLVSETRSWSEPGCVGYSCSPFDAGSIIAPSRGGLLKGAASANPNLQRPYDWEYSASIERQLGRDLAITAAFYYRKYYDLFANENTALSPADYAPVTITNPLTGGPLTVYNLMPQYATSINTLEVNSSSLLAQHYTGFEVTANKRMSNHFTVFGGFTVSSWKQCANASTDPNVLINNCGYSPYDSRYMTNISGVYNLPKGFNISSHLNYDSGKPLQTLYTLTSAVVPGLVQGQDTVALLPQGARRYPGYSLLDVRISRTFKIKERGSIEPMIEIYNLLNQNAPFSEVQTVGPSLGHISTTLDGRLTRLGIKAAF